MPREHGAWGILLVPLATGAAAGLSRGGEASGLAPLCLATLALFWLRTPLESWVGAAPVRARSAEEFRLVRGAAAGIGAAAAAAAVWLFAGGDRWGLLWIGVAAGIAFAAQWWVKRTWRGARAAAQIVGAAGLTSTAAAAYCVTAGRMDEVGWAVWAANLLFAGNQIHFVQLRIHAAHAVDRVAAGRAFLAGQAALAIALAVGFAAGMPGRYAALAFVPGLVRGFAWFARERRPLDVHALGKSELAHAIVFGVLLVAGLVY
ncbi:MAG TPA: YwiC-like family protein [Limnochordia bacterium]